MVEEQELTTKQEVEIAAQKHINHMPVIELMQLAWECVVEYYMTQATQEEIDIFVKDYSEH